jgi:hypothetical protein
MSWRLVLAIVAGVTFLGAILYALLLRRAYRMRESDLFYEVSEERTRILRDMVLDHVFDIGRRAPPEVAPPGPPQSRYANVALLGPRGGAQEGPLTPGRRYLLRLGIGPRDLASLVLDPVEFPEYALPVEGAWLDVVVSSADFDVNDGREAGGLDGATARMLLLPDGGPARTPSGEDYLDFTLRAPVEPGWYRARVGYYFRDALIQSQVIDAPVGAPGLVRAETDFTVSRSLLDLGAISDRPRVSVLLNESEDGLHHLTVRPPGGEERAVSVMSLREDSLSPLVEALRKGFAADERALASDGRSRKDLIRDLERLAPLGWKVYGNLERGLKQALKIAEKLDDAIISVSRPTTTTYTLPWNLLYRIPVTTPGKLVPCPTVNEWVESEEFADTTQPLECRYGPHAENVLCPFGFLGFRFSIECLARTDEVSRTIPVRSSAECSGIVVVGNAARPADVDHHLEGIQADLRRRFSDLRIERAAELGPVRRRLEQDQPLVYFLGHGVRPNNSSPDTYLGLANGAQLRPIDFNGWVDAAECRGRTVWDRVRPLIFLNACHSIALRPESLVGFVDAFVGSAHASGVIGTEIKVSVPVAMLIAEEFFAQLARPDDITVDRALRAARARLLKKGSIFGLVYTAYCWADLRLVPT